MPVRLVLSGGIGSGKSTAAQVLARLGAMVLSADEFARRVLDQGTAATRAVIELWPEVADAGVIDRQRLARLVFPDPERLAALEAITHPPTRAALQDTIAAAAQSDLVVEMPILRDWFDGWKVVVVDAPEEIRLARAVGRSDRMDEDDVRAIMARQPHRAGWLLAADFVIDNRGDEADLERECRALWAHVTGV